MRSTMSIPGLFSPVKVDGMVLVDGGVRNNYPVGLAKKMGADIVIGAELSDKKKDYSEVNNLGDIFGKMVSMLGSGTFEANENLADIKIKPDLHEYNMLSFDDQSIGIIIDRGYQAACDNDDELKIIKSIVGSETHKLNHPAAVDFFNEKVAIDSVKIEGVKDVERNILLSRFKVKNIDSVSRADAEHIAGQIYGTQAFDYVTYEVNGSRSPYNLTLNCKPGPIHQLGIGVRLDSEEIVSLLLNLGFNYYRLYGSKFGVEAKINANPYVKLNYAYDRPGWPTLNASLQGKFVDLNKVQYQDDLMKLNYDSYKAELYVSGIHMKHFDLKGGARGEHFYVKNIMTKTIVEKPEEYSDFKDSYLSAFIDGKADTFDDGYFPKRGFMIGAAAVYNFLNSTGLDKNYLAVTFDAKTVIRMGNHFALLPSLNMRLLFGDSVPIPYYNSIGGTMPGRYNEWQVPFAGVNGIASLREKMAVAALEARVQMFKHSFISLVGNYAKDSEKLKTFFEGKGYYGVALRYSYDSVFGPLSAGVHWSNVTNKVGVHVSAGFNF